MVHCVCGGGAPSREGNLLSSLLIQPNQSWHALLFMQPLDCFDDSCEPFMMGDRCECDVVPVDMVLAEKEIDVVFYCIIGWEFVFAIWWRFNQNGHRQMKCRLHWAELRGPN